jgi:hypothetical protein
MNSAPKLAITAAVALVIGGGIGAAAGTTKTETVTVPGPVQTKTETKTEYRTPASCTKALDDADRAFGLLQESMGLIQDRFNGGGDDAAEAANLKALNALVPTYNAAKADCRASR